MKHLKVLLCFSDLSCNPCPLCTTCIGNLNVHGELSGDKGVNREIEMYVFLSKYLTKGRRTMCTTNEVVYLNNVLFSNLEAISGNYSIFL